MSNKPILCVDFDGVIHSYTSGWKGEGVVSDPPVPGALAWLWSAMEHWDVQIYSSRSRTPEGVGAMQTWLREHGAKEFGENVIGMFMQGIKFPTQKPSAFLTIDDRAICFNGDFTAIPPRDLLSFKPWNKL